jgi:hypothetical protein
MCELRCKAGSKNNPLIACVALGSVVATATLVLDMHMHIPAPADKLRQALNLSTRSVQEAVLRPHQNAVHLHTNGGNFSAIRWSEGGHVIFVCGILEAFDRKGSTITPKSVQVQLILALRDQLPAGPISPDMKMDDILRVIASSFGLPVTGHPAHPPTHLYTGPWDGNVFGVSGLDGDDRPIGVFGSRDEITMKCQFIWAPSATRYTNWYAGWFRSRLLNASLKPSPNLVLHADNINFTPDCVTESLAMVGLTTWQVRNAVLQPTGAQSINADGFGLELFTKQVTIKQRENLILVIGRCECDRLVVAMVLVCPGDWIDNDSTIPPLTVLERLVDRVGVECDAGGLRGKLLLGQEVIMQEPNQRLDVRTIGAGQGRRLICSHTKPSNDPSKRKHKVGLCFAIDVDEYQKAIA